MKTGRRVLCLAVVGLGFLVPPASAAQSTLNGETLTASNANISATCNTGQFVSGSYSASGTATGPYPGTFTEQGTYKQTSGSQGTLSASFTIKAGAITITGTKTGTGFGDTCPENLFGTNLSYTATWRVMRGNALIATRATYTDTGTSNFANFSPFFDEDYQSSQTQATLAKCELVVLNLIALPQPLRNCA